MKPAIRIAGLSKKYKRGNSVPYLTLRDSLMGLFHRGKHSGHPDDFWALKDINLEIMPGEVVGIIGRNGAGKSTLLKILSRITHPTSGEVILQGRVGSLFEVGTGFHPELSGRENIYLNGAVLGMSRIEISQRFSQIVDFSGVADFLDTPVKHYSSGMYSRLAFAVAAHLNSKILIIDEVLAVGDMEFQKRCFSKMDDLAKNEGRTVLIVSHNLNAIKNLCTKSLLIDKGHIIAEGESAQVVEKYLLRSSRHRTTNLLRLEERSGSGEIIFSKASVTNQRGQTPRKGDSLTIKLELLNKVGKDIECRLALSIRSFDEIPLISCDSIITGESYLIPFKHHSTLSCNMSDPHLNPGKYLINVGIFHANLPIDWLQSAIEFEVLPGQYSNHVVDVPFPLYTDFEWRVT